MQKSENYYAKDIYRVQTVYFNWFVIPQTTVCWYTKYTSNMAAFTVLDVTVTLCILLNHYRHRIQFPRDSLRNILTTRSRTYWISWWSTWTNSSKRYLGVILCKHYRQRKTNIWSETEWRSGVSGHVQICLIVYQSLFTNTLVEHAYRNT